MTNKEKLMTMTDEDMARKLIQSVDTFDSDLGLSYTYYDCPDGISFDLITEAIKHTVEWLNEEE